MNDLSWPKFSEDLMKDSFSTSTMGVSCKVPSLNELKGLVDEIRNNTPTIYVWWGRRDYSLNLSISPVPILKYVEWIDKGTAYIMAGVGIIAGERAYKFLKASGVVLQWSDKYIPIEFKVLNLLGMDYEEPNEETIRAMEESEFSQLKSFNTVEELFEDLDN